MKVNSISVGTQNPLQPFRLHTFGRVFVARGSGEPLAGAATQRRTVALLALLSVAGDSGLSRDKLIGLLWPDVDIERARHSLTQALYAARKSMQADDLFVVGTDIRLNQDCIGSDFADFEAALVRGELQRAVDLYRGSFLDGFFVSGAPEFERWASAQRDRLEARAADALERLAAAAEEASDYRGAVEWRRRLSALFPLDSGMAAKLMAAMAMAGDRAGALHHANAHATLLKSELDLEPDSVVEALAARLKEPMSWPAPATAALMDSATRENADAAPTSLDTSADSEVAQPEDSFDNDTAERRSAVAQSPGQHVRPRLPAPTPLTPIAIGVWGGKPRTRRLRLGFALVMATMLVGLVIVIERARRDPAVAIRQLAPRQRVVVAPFRVAGAASGLEYLRDGIVELLSTRLADDSSARSVDAGGVLAAWRTSGLADVPTVPRDAVVSLAARLGAERVVLGSVVGTPAHLSITASVVSVPSGTTRGEATVSGRVDSITTLIDRLAARLLLAEAGEDEHLANYTSESLPALRAFLDGQAAFRRNDFISATRLYDLALRRDSTFALAALYRALAADELNDESQLRTAVAVAWNSRHALSERDRSLLVAFAGSRYPELPTTGELAIAWQRVVDLAPASAEAWSALGARLLHDGASAGLLSPLRRAADAYQRSLAMNPVYVPAWRALVQLGAATPSPPDSGPPLNSTSPQREAATRVTPFIRWRSNVTSNDTLARRLFRDSLSTLGPVNLRAIARTSQFDGIGIDDGAEALLVLKERAVRALDVASVTLAEHSLAVNRGRPREALNLTSRLRRVMPGSHAWLRLRILDALYANGDSAVADAAARELTELAGVGSSTSTTSSDIRLADECVLAQWRLARGDTTGVRDAVAALGSAPQMVSPLTLVSAAPNACAVLLDVALSVANGLPDVAVRLQRVDSMVFTPQTAGDAVAYAPLLLARLHERRGSAWLALRAIRKRTYMSGWPRYLANTLLEEGRLAVRVGDSTAAVSAYRHFLALRDTPEGALAPEVDSTRELIALRLTAPAETGQPR